MSAATVVGCAMGKTYPEGRVVMCGGNALPGLTVCEYHAVKTKALPVAALCEKSGHPWEIGNDQCPRCGQKME